jgi:hypothetical protein
MKKLIFLIVLVGVLFTTSYAFGQGSGQEVIGSGALKITIQTTSSGGEVESITNGTVELLDDVSPLFVLHITEIASGTAEAIASDSGWGNVTVSNDGTHFQLILSNPTSSNLPSSLTATVGITVTGKQSQWDLSVAGLGSNHTLTDADFPKLRFKDLGGDSQFLIPKYSGTIIHDPIHNSMDYDLFYPRGWSATMQFSAYYNNEFGVYLGFHDPKAAYKHFRIRAGASNLLFQGNVSVANKTLPSNDWEIPGHFELDVFEGDWYDAALIYKKWGEAEAEYYPQSTPSREKRQKELGSIGVWGYYSADLTYPMTGTHSIESDMRDYVDYFPGIRTGIHWYKWNTLDFDDDYPNYFPERDGTTGVVSNLQQTRGAFIMPYINGRLYDTDLTEVWDYTTRGYPFATKQTDGTVYTQVFNGNTFAVMCPTQISWQNIITDAAQQLTDRIGSKGVYIDQIAAAGPTECMDATHNHPVGGGHWWRDGYRDLLTAIHSTIPDGRFIVVEGGADYISDQVDGFLTEGWLTNNLVPAFQVVYGGKVQLIGKRTGTSRYHNQSFYCKLSQAFVQGIQPGRTSLWIVHDPNADIAAPFVKNLAIMRTKLKDFLAFGEMLRPLTLSGSIPTITSSWTDYGSPVDVTISAIQSSVYRHGNNRSVALIFANASMTDAIDFSFEFDGSQYGFLNPVTVQKVTPNSDDTPLLSSPTFTETVRLSALRTVAYIVDPYTFDVFLPLISNR